MTPASLSPKLHERLHGAHSGIESCLRRARETVYWLNLTAEIKDNIAKCEVCETYQKEQPKKELLYVLVPYLQTNVNHLHLIDS